MSQRCGRFQVYLFVRHVSLDFPVRADVQSPFPFGEVRKQINRMFLSCIFVSQNQQPVLHGLLLSERSLYTVILETLDMAVHFPSFVLGTRRPGKKPILDVALGDGRSPPPRFLMA